MQVQKTTQRNIITAMHGSFKVRETVRVCTNRCLYPVGQLITLRSHTISQLVAPGKNYGYDLEVRVGLERYLHHRQREEIKKSLEDDGITISTGTITNLAQKFVQHLELLHKMRSEKLRETIMEDGGYPLHIDATGEDGRGTLLIAMDGWRQWVLGAWKISSERAILLQHA